MEAFLRERGTPILVQKLARLFPLPPGVPRKFIKALASNPRFECQDLGGLVPTVQMRETPLPAEALSLAGPPPRGTGTLDRRWRLRASPQLTAITKTWLDRFLPSFHPMRMHMLEPQ